MLRKIVDKFKENPISSTIQVSRNAIEVLNGNFAENVLPELRRELNNLVSTKTKEDIVKSAKKIVEYTKEGLEKFNEQDFKAGFDKFKSAGKEALDCIGKLFGAIKEGLENGFDKVKNSLGLAYQKLESLTRGRVQGREA